MLFRSSFEGKSGVDLYKSLATAKVNAPCHNFYAFEASNKLGLGDGGALRAGLAPYSIKEDVDRLVEGISRAL